MKLSLVSLLPSIGLSLVMGAAQAEPASEQVLNSLFLDIDRVGSNGRLVAVGDRGHVVWSDDQGRAWQMSGAPGGVMLTALSFPSSQTGFAVGHDATIYKTVDAGESWKQVYQDKGAEIPLLDVFFDDDQNGYALGGYGYIVKTSDGGKTWSHWNSRLENDKEYHLNAMARLGNGNLLIVGEAGTLLRSTDNGDSFQALDSPYKGSFFGVQPLAEPKAAMIYGLRGNAFVTTDDGASWEALETGTEQTLYDAIVVNGRLPLLVGSSGTFALKKGDDSLVSNRPDRAAITAVIQAQDQMFIITGDNGIRRIKPSFIGL